MISADGPRAAAGDAIRDAIKLQEDIGLRSVTHGEFRRASWHMDFIYEIAGVRKAEQAMRSVFHNEGVEVAEEVWGAQPEHGRRAVA